MSDALKKIEAIEDKAHKGIQAFQDVLSATALLKKELSGGSDSSLLKSQANKVVGNRMQKLKKGA